MCGWRFILTDETGPQLWGSPRASLYAFVFFSSAFTAFEAGAANAAAAKAARHAYIVPSAGRVTSAERKRVLSCAVAPLPQLIMWRLWMWRIAWLMDRRKHQEREPGYMFGCVRPKLSSKLRCQPVGPSQRGNPDSMSRRVCTQHNDKCCGFFWSAGFIDKFERDVGWAASVCFVWRSKRLSALIICGEYVSKIWMEWEVRK